MKDNVIIVLDFDGTIVDIWDRYYKVFEEASKTNILVSKQRYREIKREYLRDDYVAEKIGIILPGSYYDKKRELLERIDFLSLDKLVIEKQKLISFVLSNECIVLTKRNNPENFFSELEYLGLTEIKSKCYVIDPTSKNSKLDFCKKKYPSSKFIAIGDSNDEYEFSREAFNSAYIVNTGLRENASFEKKENVHLISSINGFVDNY